VSSERPIGIFDSGIGGLSVTSTIRQALPTERLLYFGDGAHVPYGSRSLEEVREFNLAITDALLAKGANSASVIARLNSRTSSNEREP